MSRGGAPQRWQDWADRDPIAIPAVGATLHLSDQQWRSDSYRQGLHIKVTRVLLDGSRSFTGFWVRVEGEVSYPPSEVGTRQVMVQVTALHPRDLDPDYQPRPLRQLPNRKVDPDQLTPGVVVRIGQDGDPATPPIHVRITRAWRLFHNDQIHIEGDQLTPTGQTIAHVDLNAPPELIFTEGESQGPGVFRARAEGLKQRRPPASTS